MDFFNQNFWQQIVTAIVSGIVLMWIGTFFHKNRSIKVGSIHAEKTSKTLKGFIIIFRIMFWGGFYMFAANLSVYGFSNPYTGLGFCLAFLGFIGLNVCKLLRYWHYG